MKNVEGSLADGKALCRINGPLTERLARAALLIAAALSLCCFVFVFVLSLTGTAMLDPDNYWSEHILFSGDNLFVNLASCIGLLLLAALCKRAFGKYLTRIDPRLAAGALAA